MFFRCAFLAAVAAVAPLVAAHGHMQGAFVDDVYVPGPEPNSGDSGSFAIRQINDIDPVKGSDNADLFCGHGATPAALAVNATQGSVLKFAWINGENGPWVHEVGPVMTYMTPCGPAGCSSFDDRSAEFFKISELGQHEDATWFMKDLTVFNGTTSATVPSYLPDGEYLVRHELLALHTAESEGGAEWYIGCLQINLSGGVNTQAAFVPSGNNETATFPGAYHDDDPGVWINVYGRGVFDYPFPGPAPVSDASTPPPSDGSSTDVPANTSGTPTTTDSATPTATNGCGHVSKKKKRVVKRIVQKPLVKRSHRVERGVAENRPNLADWKRDTYEPVARSRVMRGI